MPAKHAQQKSISRTGQHAGSPDCDIEEDSMLNVAGHARAKYTVYGIGLVL